MTTITNNNNSNNLHCDIRSNPRCDLQTTPLSSTPENRVTLLVKAPFYTFLHVDTKESPQRSSPPSSPSEERVASAAAPFYTRLHVVTGASPQRSSPPSSPSEERVASAAAPFYTRLHVVTDASPQRSSPPPSKESDSPEDMGKEAGLNRKNSLNCRRTAYSMLKSNEITPSPHNEASIAPRNAEVAASVIPYAAVLPHQVPNRGTPNNNEILTPFREFLKEYEFLYPGISMTPRAVVERVDPPTCCAIQ